jgi:phosphatidylinositol-3-phosphatase
LRRNRILVAVAAIVAVATMTLVTGVYARGGSTNASANRDGSQAGKSAAIPRFQHVFLIMMENHSFDEIIGNANAPQINALARRNGLATSYFGVTHPSLPNYIASISGDFFGIANDAPPTAPGHTLAGPSLVDQLDAKGLTWKTYQQSIPFPGFTGAAFPSASNALYAVKHNPFAYLARVRNDPAALAKMVPDTQLAADLASEDDKGVPSFSYIVPDQCHDMHGLASCPDDAANIRAGDAYVNATVNLITRSAAWRDGNNAIVVTWDENDFNAAGVTGCCDANPGGGRVATIVITNHGDDQGGRPLVDNTPYNHYSLLRTLEAAFRLDGCLNHTCDAANVPLMTPLFGEHGDD